MADTSGWADNSSPTAIKDLPNIRIRPAMHGDAYLKRYIANTDALEKIKPGDTRKGWKIILISYQAPWGYVLLKKGDVVVRQSPRGFLEM